MTKKLAFTLILLFTTQSWALPILDPKYDNYEGVSLVLKLIDDGQLSEAKQFYESDKPEYIKKSPADAFLIEGLVHLHENRIDLAMPLLSESLDLKYSDIALTALLNLYSKQKIFEPGLIYLEKNLNRITEKSNPSAELAFLALAPKRNTYQVRSIQWLESYLQRRSHFSVLKLYVDFLMQNKLINQARWAIESAFEKNQIVSAGEILTLIEPFFSQGFDLEIYPVLEKAHLRFQTNDLIKLNLAQVMFKKDMNLSALMLLSEIKPDDGLLNVKLELMNLMNVKSYSLYHRMQVQNNDLHLKNWFIYFINNEAWTILYGLYPKYNHTSWANDELNYAMAYSAQLAQDSDNAKLFANLIQSTSLTEKKAKLLQSLSEREIKL